jgi:hypothetical protein
MNMEADRTKALAIALAVVVALAVAAVSVGLSLGRGPGQVSPLAGASSTPTRTLVPTFTPTPMSNRTPSPTPNAVTPTPSPLASPVARVKENRVNVRQGPGTGYPKVGQVMAGDELTVTGRNDAGDWLRIEEQEKSLSGWVFTELVELAPPVETVAPVSDIPPSPTPIPAPPTPTPTPPEPTATPTAELDFRVALAQLLPIEENGGCLGMHTIFITVLDAAGNPLDGIVVGDTYNNVESATGSKGPGKAEIDLWLNAMEITVKRDQDGRTYKSEATRTLSSQTSLIPPEDKLAAGYCVSMGHCIDISGPGAGECHGHFSWRVTFQRSF